MNPAFHAATTAQIIAMLRGDGPFLFLGSVFIAAGLISAAFALLRRKSHAMFLWLAASAVLYGLRLWLQLGTLSLVVAHSAGFETLRYSLNYLVPIPVTIFFDVAGFLGQYGRRISISLAAIFLPLVAITAIAGYQQWIDNINSGIVVIGLSGLIIFLFRRRDTDRDFVIIRWALTVFVAFAVFDNLGDLLGIYPRIEPVGFAIFLASLGYVAARRALRRDEQLVEIEKELAIARQIQTAILPAAYPASKCFAVAARYAPMTSVAGDFYDFPIALERQAGILIADVAGHGVPAALIASMVKLAAVSQSDHAGEPAQFLAGMNKVLCGNTQNQFVTAAYLYLDAECRTLSYSAAGHPPMLLLRDGVVHAIEENGLMLAAFSFAAYTRTDRTLASGDRLLLYTDGLVEASDRQGMEYGQARLEASLAATSGLSADQAAHQLIATIQNWSPVQSDDLTLLVCDYLEAD